MDSIAIFSVRKHFSVVSTSIPLPTTLAKSDSIVVTMAFERPDAGLTSGSLRVYSNDERQSAKQVRLVGTVLTTDVEDEVLEPSSVLVLDVVPHPVSESAVIRMQVFHSEMLRDARIIIRDLVGQHIATILAGDIVDGEQRFDLPRNIPTGSYIISVESNLVRQSIPLIINR